MAKSAETAHRMALARAARRRAAKGDLRRVRRRTERGEFDLTYLRTGGGEGPPVFVLPGGPGLASVLPYEDFRKRATARGLDVLMMEHRGIGFSRQDTEGVDLPRSELTVAKATDDMAAVLDDCGLDRAVIYGCSYGSYLAAAFGARHPRRVAGMVLDSTFVDADCELASTAELRRLFWDGADERSAEVAAKIRTLVQDGLVPAERAGFVVQAVYEFGGLALLADLVDAVLAGNGARTWRWVAGFGDGEVNKTLRYFSEFDLVGTIAYRELGYGRGVDDKPLNANTGLAEAGERFPPFAGEEFDLHAALPGFDWPTMLISGERDLRTPRGIAEYVAATVPDGTLLGLPGVGHSVLDCHPLAALLAADAVVSGTQQRLPALADRVAALPKRGRQTLLGPMIRGRLTLDRMLPRRG